MGTLCNMFLTPHLFFKDDLFCFYRLVVNYTFDILAWSEDCKQGETASLAISRAKKYTSKFYNLTHYILFV